MFSESCCAQLAHLAVLTAHSPGTKFCASVFCADTPELPPFGESLMELFAEETEVRTSVLISGDICGEGE